MANEEFGLGFTTEGIAIWNNGETLGPQSTLFTGNLALLENAGPQSTIFAEIALLENAGPQASISVDAICHEPSVLNGVPYSTLVQDGGPQNIMGC